MKYKNIYIYFLMLLLLLGFWVRYTGLDTHFTHVDDIDIARTIIFEKELRKNSENPFKNVKSSFKASNVIARNLTYAPAQFWITSWLVYPDQSYKEILFWGRVPSFVFGMSALIALLIFYRKFNPTDPFSNQVIGLTLMAFSWENIIYTQQMESYAIGVFSILLLLIILLHYLNLKELSIRKLLLLSLMSAGLVHTQYQIFFFIPALYLVLFSYHWKRSVKRIALVKYFFMSCLSFVLLNIPMYMAYLRHHAGNGINWNAGIKGEFLFNLPQASDMADKALYIFKFFTLNFISVFQMEIAFMPENNKIYQVFSLLLLLLFFIGVLSLTMDSDIKKKFFALFIGISAITWIVLIVAQKIALSPTRHNLILLPFFAIGISEGFTYMISRIHFLRNKNLLSHAGSIMLSISTVTLFLLFYKDIASVRKDAFSSVNIQKIADQYQADAIIPYCYTRNIELMKDIKNKYVVFEGEQWKSKCKKDFTLEQKLQTVCLISARLPYPYLYFNSANGFLDSEGKTISCDSSNADYILQYKKEIRSNVEVDFSEKTKNGSNDLYLYVFSRITPL